MGIAATTWVTVGARVPILSPNDDPNNFRGPLNDQQTAISGLSGGHSPDYMGPVSAERVPKAVFQKNAEKKEILKCD